MKALILLLLCSPVLADDLYYQTTLTGTTVMTSGIQVNNIPTSDIYTLDVNITGPLAPNLNNSIITPNYWTVTCSSCLSPLSSNAATFPSNSLGILTATFAFSTDATGKITSAIFTINSNFEQLDPASPNGCCMQMGTSSFGSGDVVSGWSSYNQWQTRQYLSGPKGTWTQSSLSNAPVVASNVQLRTCNSSWGPVSNSVPAGVTPNASGAGLYCTGALKGEPGSYYTKVTTDGGKTFAYVTLKSLGLGNGK